MNNIIIYYLTVKGVKEEEPTPVVVMQLIVSGNLLFKLSTDEVYLQLFLQLYVIHTALQGFFHIIDLRLLHISLWVWKCEAQERIDSLHYQNS